MSADKVTVRNIHTGTVGEIRRVLFENPAINNGILEEVEEDSKPYVPEMHKSRLKEPAEDTATAPEVTEKDK